jgi:hypothetical protein
MDELESSRVSLTGDGSNMHWATSVCPRNVKEAEAPLSSTLSASTTSSRHVLEGSTAYVDEWGLTSVAHLHTVAVLGHGVAPCRGHHLEQAAPQRLHQLQVLLPPLLLQQLGQMGSIGLGQL